MRHVPYPPTDPFRVDPGDDVATVLDKMRHISFQGRNLGAALDIWRQMLADECTIWFGLSGAMSAGGMRRIVSYLIKNHYIDVLVSTGANLFHDVYETLGRHHYIGSPGDDDVELRELRMDRVYDTYADEVEFRWLDRWILNWAHAEFDPSERVTTREFFRRLGAHLTSEKKDDGIVTSAYEAGVPIFCPAIADSSYGIALADCLETRERFAFDMVRDVEETALIFAASSETAVIYCGGGTPKNYIQQSSVIFDQYDRGHKYAIQFTADAPHWGGLSGCTFSEAKSWGKIQAQARLMSVYVDATIALPMIATGLSQSAGDLAAERKRPAITHETQLVVNGLTISGLRKRMREARQESPATHKQKSTAK